MGYTVHHYNILKENESPSHQGTARDCWAKRAQIIIEYYTLRSTSSLTFTNTGFHRYNSKVKEKPKLENCPDKAKAGELS